MALASAEICAFRQMRLGSEVEHPETAHLRQVLCRARAEDTHGQAGQALIPSGPDLDLSCTCSCRLLVSFYPMCFDEMEFLGCVSISTVCRRCY